MNQTTLQACLAIALTLGIQSVCSAQNVITETKTTTAGPPVVLDSYMTPAVVRTRETTDAEGNTQKTMEPLILERHERVMLPNTETTSTDVRTAGSTVTTETRQLVKKTFSPKAVRPSAKIAHRQRHHRTAYRRPHAAVAESVSVQTRTVEPTVIQHQESTVEKATVIERRDPALDLR